MSTTTSTISIRLAAPADRRAVARLAALDSAPVPRGDVLIAVVDGDSWAALPLGGGRPVADPFRPTDDLVALLRARAAHLAAPAVAPRPRLRHRLAARQS